MHTQRLSNKVWQGAIDGSKCCVYTSCCWWKLVVNIPDLLISTIDNTRPCPQKCDFVWNSARIFLASRLLRIKRVLRLVLIWCLEADEKVLQLVKRLFSGPMKKTWLRHHCFIRSDHTRQRNPYGLIIYFCPLSISNLFHGKPFIQAALWQNLTRSGEAVV